MIFKIKVIEKLKVHYNAIVNVKRKEKNKGKFLNLLIFLNN
jgi:hypothetical protein